MHSATNTLISRDNRVQWPDEMEIQHCVMTLHGKCGNTEATCQDIKQKGKAMA